MEQDRLYAYLSQLEEVFGEFVKRMHAEFTQNLFGVTPSQFVVLSKIQKRGRMTISEIADGMGVSLSAVTALSDRLYKAGMVERQRDDKDRRLVWLEITPQGRKSVDFIKDERNRIAAKYFGQLPDEDVERLIEIFKKLLVILRDAGTKT